MAHGSILTGFAALRKSITFKVFGTVAKAVQDNIVACVFLIWCSEYSIVYDGQTAIDEDNITLDYNTFSYLVAVAYRYHIEEECYCTKHVNLHGFWDGTDQQVWSVVPLCIMLQLVARGK